MSQVLHSISYLCFDTHFKKRLCIITAETTEKTIINDYKIEVFK